MSVNAKNGILLSAISAINAIAIASIAALNGETKASGETELFSDAFTSASDQALATYSAAWTVMQGSFIVNGTADAARSTTASTTCLARRNDITPNVAQYVQVVREGIAGSVYHGPALRMQSGAATAYHVDTDGSDNYLVRTVTGADTVLVSGGSFTMTLAAGDVCRLEATNPDANTVRLVVKKALAASPTSFSTILTFDDTNAARITAAGSLGIFGYSDNTSAAQGITSVSGGNL